MTAHYLELAQDAFVWAVGIADTARVVNRLFTQVHQLTKDRHVENILVQVFALDVKYPYVKRVAIRVKQPNRRDIPILERRVRPIHVQLQPLKDTKAHLERLVDEQVDFAKLDSEKIFSENLKVNTVRLFGESVRLRLIVQ